MSRHPDTLLPQTSLPTLDCRLLDMVTASSAASNEPTAHAIQSDLYQLQQQLAQLPAEQCAAPQAVLDALAGKLHAQRDALADSNLRLLDSDDTLQGLLGLLQHADDEILPARHLAALLRPLQQQFQDIRSDISQLL